MTTTELEIIKALAEEGNMRKAAERLFLSQPALSQRLQNIEKEWGTIAFHPFSKGHGADARGRACYCFRERNNPEKRRNG